MKGDLFMSYESEELWQAMKTSKYRDTLDEMSRIVNGAKTLDEVLELMINSIVEAIHAETGTLWYYDYSLTGKIIPKAVYGGGEIDGFRLEPGEGVAGSVVSNNAPVIIKDCQKDPRWSGKVDAKTGFKTKSMICVPLAFEKSGTAFGCVQIINDKDGNLFDDNDLDFAEKLAKEFSRLYVEKAQNQIFGYNKGYNFDKALSQDNVEKAIEVISDSLTNYNFEEKRKEEIIKHFTKIYELLK